MISTARIQAQVRQLQQFDIAITNFKQKFNSIPGDCCDHSPHTNGNNNNKIDDTGGNSPPVTRMMEPEFFFIDMHTMGILEKNYNINVTSQWLPSADIKRGSIMASGNAFGDIYYTFVDANLLGATVNFSVFMAQGNFSPAEALVIDTKQDDGLPASGNVQSTSATPAASTSTMPFTADTDNSATCIYNAKYNTVLTATNLCRLVVKSNFY